MSARVLRLIAIVIVGLGINVSAAAAQSMLGGRTNAPGVPSNLDVPAGHAAFLEVHAIGTQNYICLPTPAGLAWRFIGPQATLFEKFLGVIDHQVATHFLAPNPFEAGLARPSWQHSFDSSQVWGRALASSSDPAFVEPGAIPWLLLEVAGARPGPLGGRLLAHTTFIQRLRTSGGAAPSTTCSEVGAFVMVPYRTDYVFFRRAKR